MTSWRFGTEHGPASSLFATDPLAEPVARTITVRTVTRPTVVLGSAQREDVVDAVRARNAGVTVVRRRSGGGAVWLDPDSISWLDITIPIGDVLWEHDIARAFWWLGDVWAAVIGGTAASHRGALVRTPWSATVCFAGLGSGEVTIDGSKAVGVAQRRTRAGALFQCGVIHRWDPLPLLDALALSDEQREQGRQQLRTAGIGIAGAGIVERFVTAMEGLVGPDRSEQAV